MTYRIALLSFLVACGSPTTEISNTAENTTQEGDLESDLSDDAESLCGAALPGQARCFALARLNKHGVIANSTHHLGQSPSDIQKAYNLDISKGAGVTVAIVDAFDDPNAESDLAVYRAAYNLPACTTANGCFKKVNQRGEQANYPKPDKGWAGEIALDLDMVSAACPLCNILLVESDDNEMDSLGAAVNTAVALGAAVVSNSYGGEEDNTIVDADEKYFKHPGTGIFVSSGDSGYGAAYPASSKYAIAVGGTSLRKSSSEVRGYAETAWNGAGSGCSAFVAKPAWQTDTGCANRSVADVAAVADPATGVSSYNTYGHVFGWFGWTMIGGTSASAPIVAAIFAMTGHGADDASYIWNNAGSFNDVKSGSNGSCQAPYLCKAGEGFDGPTGFGTPNAKQM